MERIEKTRLVALSRRPYFDSPAVYDLFVEVLESARRRSALRVYGYVVMPEHVH